MRWINVNWDSVEAEIRRLAEERKKIEYTPSNRMTANGLTKDPSFPLYGLFLQQIVVTEPIV
jgi:hypothetical protein